VKSWLYLVSCNLMWALQFTCIKLVQDQVGPLFTVWAPMFFATLLLYPLVRREAKQNGPAAIPFPQRRDIGLFLMLALLGVLPGQTLITIGTRMSLASNAALLQLALPVCTAAMAFLILHEKITVVRAVSFLIAIAGVLLCSVSDLKGLNLGTGYLLGNSLIFLGVLGSAFYNSYGKRVLETRSELQMLFGTYVATLLLMAPFVFMKEGHTLAQVGGFHIRTWIGLLLLTFFHNFLSMVLFLIALKHLDASQAALSNYLITAFGVVIAAVWLHEKLTLNAVIGGILVLAGTLLVTVWEGRRAATATPVPLPSDPKLSEKAL
jgi:drug/metabolite transporter (DMT)-like permease